MKVSIDLPDDIQVLWPEANRLAKENGVLIEGDMNKGSFSIKGISATYIVNGRTLTVFAKVPFLLAPFVTEQMVRGKIQEWFNSRK